MHNNNNINISIIYTIYPIYVFYIINNMIKKNIDNNIKVNHYGMLFIPVNSSQIGKKKC